MWCENKTNFATTHPPILAIISSLPVASPDPSGLAGRLFSYRRWGTTERPACTTSRVGDKDGYRRIRGAGHDDEPALVLVSFFLRSTQVMFGKNNTGPAGPVMVDVRPARTRSDESAVIWQSACIWRGGVARHRHRRSSSSTLRIR